MKKSAEDKDNPLGSCRKVHMAAQKYASDLNIRVMNIKTLNEL